MSDLDQARQDLSAAAARLRRAEVLENLAHRPGAAYAAIDDDGNYVVTLDGNQIGTLQHPPGESWLRGWTARVDGHHGAPLGPYPTPRIALKEILNRRPSTT